MRIKLVIDALGGLGEGIAHLEAETIFVPLALPGEEVVADVSAGRGRLVSIERASPERDPPKCPHFGLCGGCTLQHLKRETYLELKRDMLVQALGAHGVEAHVDPVVETTPASRRRATFAAVRQPNGEVAFGLHARRAHEIIPVPHCAVMTPMIMRVLPQIERLAKMAAPRRGALQAIALETATGIDLALTPIDKTFNADDRARLAASSAAAAMTRVSLDGEVVVQRAAPVLKVGGAHLAPAPGAFAQASEAAEEAMAKLVLEAIGEPKLAADLFAGSGAFALRIAQRSAVNAFESEAAALNALREAARIAQRLKPIKAERRDLFRSPLMVRELADYDALVMDPPRAGAQEQSRQLAQLPTKSSLRRLAMVSCSAGTLGRDLAILLGGGWRVRKVTPVDQFLWSPHIEAVVALER